MFESTIAARSIAVSGDEEEDDDGWQKYDGDEMINNQEEVAARRARVVFVPPKLKATIQFGYETSMKSALPADQDFDSWIAATFVHTQAHFKHSKSLGTMIEFEARKYIPYHLYYVNEFSFLVRQKHIITSHNALFLGHWRFHIQ